MEGRRHLQRRLALRSACLRTTPRLTHAISVRQPRSGRRPLGCATWDTMHDRDAAGHADH